MGSSSLTTMWATIVLVAIVAVLPAPVLGTGASSNHGFASEQLVPNGLVSWEPTIATDPSSGYVYQAVTAINGSAAPGQCPGCTSASPNKARIQIRVSSDAGATWGPVTTICPCPGQNWQYDPQLQVSTNGTVFAAFLQTFDPGVVLYKSYDHGQTWQGPVTVSGRLPYTDKPILVISPSGQDVYLAFNGHLAGEWVAVSHDYGQTFAPALEVSTGPWGAYGGTMTPSGGVYFAMVLTGKAPPEQIAVLRSTDRGATWTFSLLDSSAAPMPCGVQKKATCYYAYFLPKDAIASDSTGALTIVYTANAADGTAQSLYMRTSTDGRAWSDRVLLNDQGDNFNPQLASGTKAGDFRLAWQDNRNAACWSCGGIGGWNTWYEQTTDGGKTWSASLRLSDLGSGAAYKTPTGYLWPDGDYFGLATSVNGVNYAIWGEADGTSLYCCGGVWYTQGTLTA